MCFLQNIFHDCFGPTGLLTIYTIYVEQKFVIKVVAQGKLKHKIIGFTQTKTALNISIFLKGSPNSKRNFQIEMC